MQASINTTPARSMYRIVASFVLLSSLAACGYKGPLYMPPPPPPPDASLTTPPAAPIVPDATATPSPALSK